MFRSFAVAFAILLGMGIARADDAKKLVIRWHGQSFFEIKTTAGTRIVLDPHAIAAYGRKSVEADLVLMSHLHNDHTQGWVVTNFDKVKKFQGLKDEKGDGKHVDWSRIDEKFRDVQIKTVGTYHDDIEGMQRGKNTVFILEVDGLRIAHLGDLGHALNRSDVKRIGPIDILMIPVGGVFTINGSEAQKVVEQLKPRQYIFPMHYGTKVYDAILPPDEFLDEQKKGSVKQLATNEFLIDPASKPAEPQVIVLQWEKGG